MTRDDFQPIYEEILDIGFDDYSNLSPEERVLFNVTPLIDLGPMDHYQNSGADYNNDTLEDLAKIGAKKAASLLEELNKLFPDGIPPEDSETRNELMLKWEKHEEFVQRIDNDFFDLVEELEIALLEYTENTMH